MRIVGIILGLLVVAVLAVLGIASQQPPGYKTVRSISSSAAPSDVYAILENLRRFPDWSPWDKMDPSVKRSFEGTTGVGSSFAWDGNAEVGAGKMTITGVKPGQSVDIDLVFLRPFASEAKVVLSAEPEGPGSKITWAMSGENAAILPKVMHMFMDFDKMIGPDFERGLAQLKTLAEETSHSNGAIVP